MSAESAAPDPTVVERFAASSGRILGWVVVVIGLAVTVGAVLDLNRETTDVVAALGLVLAAFGWASMVHPGIWVTRDDLVMRGMVSTVHIPLAGIESYAVRQYVVVHAGDKKYVSSVLGKKRRSLMGQLAGARRVDPEPVEKKFHEMDPVEHFEDRLGTHTDQARVRAGVRLASAQQLALGARARRTWDPVPMLVVGLPLVLFVVALAVN